MVSSSEYGSFFSADKIRAATSQARYGQAQLLGLIANHKHSLISRSDVVPQYMTKQTWSKSVQKALALGYLHRVGKGKALYAQGNLPDGTGEMHHAWVGQSHLFSAIQGGNVFDSSPDCEDLCVVHYTAVVIEVMKIIGEAPLAGLRRFIGCPKEIWDAVMDNLYDTSNITHYDWPKKTLVYNEVPLQFQEDFQ